MKILVTGANGFVGKNICTVLHGIKDGKDKTRELIVDDVYEYDKNTSDLVLKDGVNAGYAIAKRVSDIVNPDMIKSNKIYV